MVKKKTAHAPAPVTGEQVRLKLTAFSLTQRDYVAYLRAWNTFPALDDKALVLEQQLQIVQAAALAGWLDCGELDASNVQGWPLSVSISALATEITTLLAEARSPDPKA